MSQRLTVLPIATMFLLIGVLIAACSGDGDDTGNGGADTDGTEPAGSATLTIGDESWSFDNVLCSFSQEETSVPHQSFNLNAFSETAEGVQIKLDATIVDFQEDGRYEGDDVTYGIFLNDTDEIENATLYWFSLSQEDGLFEVEPIHVDGKSVTADMTFADLVTSTADDSPGTLRATCP